MAETCVIERLKTIQWPMKNFSNLLLILKVFLRHQKTFDSKSFSKELEK